MQAGRPRAGGSSAEQDEALAQARASARLQGVSAGSAPRTGRSDPVALATTACRRQSSTSRTPSQSSIATSLAESRAKSIPIIAAARPTSGFDLPEHDRLRTPRHGGSSLRGLRSQAEREARCRSRRSPSACSRAARALHPRPSATSTRIRSSAAWGDLRKSARASAANSAIVFDTDRKFARPRESPQARRHATFRMTVKPHLHRSAALKSVAEHESRHRPVGLVSRDVRNLAGLPGIYAQAVEARVVSEGGESDDHVLARKSHRPRYVAPGASCVFGASCRYAGPS